MARGQNRDGEGQVTAASAGTGKGVAASAGTGKEPDIAALLPAARGARDSVLSRGSVLTRDTLAAQLRRDGHPVRNARVSQLLSILKTRPRAAAAVHSGEEQPGPGAGRPVLDAARWRANPHRFWTCPGGSSPIGAVSQVHVKSPPGRGSQVWEDRPWGRYSVRMPVAELVMPR